MLLEYAQDTVVLKNPLYFGQQKNNDKTNTISSPN